MGQKYKTKDEEEVVVFGDEVVDESFFATVSDALMFTILPKRKRKRKRKIRLTFQSRLMDLLHAYRIGLSSYSLVEKREWQKVARSLLSVI